ncbi:MAG TPA: hypothetical protein PLT91_04315 [Clostridia bacterium]|jgi:hypothetical protein|nr:MAG: hypothetical protein BWX97_02260 [Firmicutes bacterium ADurb.Bin146]HOD92638.1 hypothetical protein [Clostridia bacterium]HQM39448.1 hypothetical protein [Clostridia bacterium]
MAKRITTLILVAIMAFALVSCNNNTDPTESVMPSFVVSTDEEWPSEYFGSEVLPKIENGNTNYYKFYDQVLRIYVYNVDDEAFLKYIETLKRTGYKDITIETKEAFVGSLDQYDLVINRDADTQRMVIELTTPLTWPKEGYITMLSAPAGAKIIQIIGESNNITVVTEDIGKQEFDLYTADAIAIGFSTILVTSETVFVAENNDYILTIVRQPEKNTMDIGIYEKN